MEVDHCPMCLASARIEPTQPILGIAAQFFFEHTGVEGLIDAEKTI